MGFNDWESDWRRRGKGLATTSTWILGQNSHQQGPIVISTSVFAFLQNQTGGGLCPENLLECRSAWFGFSQEGFASPKAWFAHTPARSRVIAPPARGVSPGSIWPEGLARAPEAAQLCNPWWEAGRKSWSPQRKSQYQAWRALPLLWGRGISLQSRLSVVPSQSWEASSLKLGGAWNGLCPSF